MIPELAVPSWLVVVAVLAVVALGGAVVWLSGKLREARIERAEANARLSEAAGSAEQLREQLTDIEEQLRQQAELARHGDRAPVVVDDREFVITDLGRERPLVPGLPAPVFVDTLLRESLVRTASLAAGLRHALSPEIRNRIRFEMKREVKRSRKQRKADARLVRRELQARRRAGIEIPG